MGKLADKPGYLIQLPRSSSTDTQYMRQVEDILMKLHVDGWHWTITHGAVTIRAYTRTRSTARGTVVTLATLAALVALATYLFDDIHRIAETAGLGSYTPG